MTKSLITDVTTIIHEILHILGFSTMLFNFFPRVNDQFVFSLADDKHYYYRGVELISQIQKHFKCTSVTESIQFYFFRFWN